MIKDDEVVRFRNTEVQLQQIEKLYSVNNLGVFQNQFYGLNEDQQIGKLYSETNFGVFQRQYEYRKG